MPQALTGAQESDLRRLMARLSFPVASKLLAAIERDRLVGGDDLPHELLIDYIRPKILEAGGAAPRIPSAQRMLCQPFEDLLHIGELHEKEFGRISRRCIAPMWGWLESELMPDELPSMQRDVEQAVLADSDEKIMSAAGALQRAASERMRQALEEASASRSSYKALADKLGGALIVDDIREVATILEFGPEIMEVQNRFARPIDHMTDEDLFDFRKHYSLFADRIPAMVPHLMLIMMGRMKRPWEMLGIVGSFTQASDDAALSSSADVGVVGDSLLRDAERLARDLERDERGDIAASTTIVMLEQLTDLIQGITFQLGIRKDGEWGQRILRCRQRTSDVMERRMNQAAQSVAAALPKSEGAPTGIVSGRPDLSKQPDGEALAKGVDAAKLIAGVKPFAAKAAFAAAQMSAADAAIRAVRAYAGDLVDEIRAQEGQERHIAQRLMDSTLQIGNHILDKDEVDLIRRRAAAASKAA